MTGFAADWLALREPADAAARAGGLLAELRLPSADATLEIVDLGAGTGANMRWLAPRLACRQRWLLVDDDDGLLRRAPAAAATRRVDLAVGLPDVELPPGGLVTASALLDLVSDRWLHALAAHCSAARISVLFALTYDGRIEAAPFDDFDSDLRALVNRHQRRDKGFGPALGPAAAAATLAAFEAQGYVLRTARSDWRLEPAHAALQSALIDGWAAAAVEMAPEDEPAIERWRVRRLEHVAAGRSQLRVGHVDVVGRPPDVTP